MTVIETLGELDTEGEALFKRVTSILTRNQGEVDRFMVQRDNSIFITD